MAADGGLHGSVILKGDFPIAFYACLLYAQVSGSTYVSQFSGAQKHNDAILQKVYGYIARIDRLLADGRPWLSGT